MAALDCGPGAARRLSRIVQWPAGMGTVHLGVLLGFTEALNHAGVSGGRAWWLVSHLTRGLGMILGGRDRCILRAFDGRFIEVALDDDYWMPSALTGYYEPEVGRVLERVLPASRGFVDAGANLGWWSLFASLVLDPGKIVAIEPARRRFADLERNAELNGGCYVCLRAALWDTPVRAMKLRIRPRGPEAASVVVRPGCTTLGGEQVEWVPAITLEDVVRRIPAFQRGGLVLKLDIEGAELEAIRGARQELAAFDTIIYEEHGRARGAKVTAELLRRDFWIGQPLESGDLNEIVTEEAVSRLKRDERRGYNFVALRRDSPAFRRLVLGRA